MIGTPDWKPRVWPLDAAAGTTLRGWLTDPDSTLYALNLDFRGADLAGAVFTEAWLSGSNFSGSSLRDALLWRAHCEEARFNDARLQGIELIRAFLRAADFSGASMAGAKLGRAECIRTSFVRADLRCAAIGDAMLVHCDMRGADLRGSRVEMTAFDGTDLTGAAVTGMGGTVVGSIIVTENNAATECEGARMQRWFRLNGADVIVAG